MSARIQSIQHSLKAKKPTRYYTFYPYFTIPTANQTNESIARARRTQLFATQSNLSSCKIDKDFQKLFEKARSAMHLDHISAWKSQNGTKFILNEPYHAALNFDQALGAQGLIYITVPTDLSPYCGKWDATPGEQPWTTSYLICEEKYKNDLEAIDKSLTACAISAPEWNSLKGVHHGA